MRINVNYWLLGALAFGGTIAVVKTRYEIRRHSSTAWQADATTRWVEEAAEHNPSIWWPNPEDVATERDPVRPVRTPTEIPGARVRLAWGHGEVEIEMEQTGTGGEPFVSRVVQDFRTLAAAVPPGDER